MTDEIERKKIDDFTQDDNNANIGTERGRALLETSMENLGAGRSILVDKNGKIIAGNKTHEVAGAIGIEDVLVVKTDGNKLVVVQREDLDLDDETGLARQLAYADNRVSQIDLNFDPEVVLGDIERGLDVSDFWFEWEIAEAFKHENAEEKAEPAEPKISEAEKLQVEWQTALGQLWELPSRDGKNSHFIICGDCRDREVVNRLMGGFEAHLVTTDPPYNVSYQDNESIESLKARNRRTDGLVVDNDSMTDEEFFDFLTSSILAWPLRKGGSYYMCSPAGRDETVF